MRLLTTTLLFPDNPIFQVYLIAEHRHHQILPGLVRDGDIGFQGIVLHLCTSAAYLYRRYDNLLLPEQPRSAPSCKETGLALIPGVDEYEIVK